MINSISPSEKVLKQYFGFDSFREGQKEIVDSIISGQDTLAIRSTGSGKSICFQVPALYFPHLTLVISPLISLMTDQVQALVQKNIPATFINSSLPADEIKTRIKNLNSQKYKLLYLSPEKLESTKFAKVLSELSISFIAVDEAHCISMWGHDFRPSYTHIPNFVKLLKKRPVIAALTATATPKIANDIVSCLALKQPVVFKQSSLRTNLQLNFIRCDNIAIKQLYLLKLLLKHSNDSGIIYCSTRKETERVAALINHLNLDNKLTHTPVLPYHGGLESAQREKVQQQFICDESRLISATNAFGMGVDKSNIRFVIHYQLPANIENYYQEVGRAGRDGESSNCYLLFHQKDVYIQEGMISKTSPAIKKIEKEKFVTFLEMVLGKSCLQKKLAEYFGDELADDCGVCSNCRPLEIKFSQDEKNRWDNIQQHQLLQKLPQQLQLLITLINPSNLNEWQQLPAIGEGLKKEIEKYINNNNDILGYHQN